MVSQISFGLNILLVLIVIFFLIRPERILAKKPHLTAKNLRIRLGIALVLGLVGLGLKLPALLQKETPADSQSKVVEKFFRGNY